jgi:hypothetical protein
LVIAFTWPVFRFSKWKARWRRGIPFASVKPLE